MKTMIPAIAPEGRIVGAYDRLVGEVEARLEDIRSELRGAGYDGTDAEVLNTAFQPDYIEGVERAKLDNVEGPVRELLEGVALAKVAPLVARCEELSKDITHAGLRLEDGRYYPLWLKYNDFENVGGVLHVKPSRRDRFIDDNTRRLTEAEQDAYIKFAGILPTLKELKAAGWHVQRIVDDALGHFDFQQGFDLNGEELAKAVCKFHKTIN